METPKALLKFIAKAALNAVGGGILGDLAVEVLPDLAQDVWAWWAKNPHFPNLPPVALKFCLDPAAKDRLLRHEASVLNQVMHLGRHPGIVALQHTYLSADPPCLEYEYVEGGDLAGLIREWHDRPA